MSAMAGCICPPLKLLKRLTEFEICYHWSNSPLPQQQYGSRAKLRGGRDMSDPYGVYSKICNVWKDNIFTGCEITRWQPCEIFL